LKKKKKGAAKSVPRATRGLKPRNKKSKKKTNVLGARCSGQKGASGGIGKKGHSSTSKWRGVSKWGLKEVNLRGASTRETRGRNHTRTSKKVA